MGKQKISYKMNIGLYFFFASFILLVVITSSFYLFVKDKLYTEVIDNLKSTVELGATGIDTVVYKRLLSKLSSSSLSSAEISAIENSEDYKQISFELNKIRDSKKGLILYTYILIPTADPHKAKFVADADVLLLNMSNPYNSDISHFGKEYDISTQEVTQLALTKKINIVDSKFVYDKQFHVNSVMGFAPIYDKTTKEFLGILGADISDKNISAFLDKILIVSFIILIVALVVVIFISIFLAGSVSKPISNLSEIVKRFSNKNFDERATLHTHIKEISELIDNFNSMAQTIQDYNEYMLALNSSYERFVPVEFLNFLSKENITQVKLGDQIQKDMAVMFSDIRFFSTLSESMTPKQTFNFLNSYLQKIGPVIRHHTGFIDKYLGDGIMALFPKTADDAILAAIDMRQKLIEYNKERLQNGLVEINAGVGIHIGTLMLGTIGEEKRMQGTVISDSVNLASRLESLTKDFGVSILISKEVFNRLESPEKYKHRFLGNTNVKGKTESVAVFEIYNSDSDELISLKDSTKRDFENGIYHYTLQNYKEAQELFNKVITINPKDSVSLIYLNKCREFLQVQY